MLYIIRHGKTSLDEKGRIVGAMDLPLSREGIEVAKKFKNHFADINIDLIITSPLTRAKQTAITIDEGKNIEIIIDQRIVERNMGNYEMREIPSFKEVVSLWNVEENADNNYIEPIHNFRKRVYDFMDDIIEKYQDKDVLIVTHPSVTGFINCYLDEPLYEGYVHTKFLSEDEVRSYNIKNNIKKVYKPKPEFKEE